MNKNFFFTTIVYLSGIFFLSSQVEAAVQVGSNAPEFEAISLDGKKVNLSEFKGKTVVLEWFNPSCPFVKKHYDTQHMQKLQEDYTSKGVVWLTINSTNPNHQDYMDQQAATKNAESLGIKSTANLTDPDGKIGHEYGAKSTPHMFVIDPNGKIAYEGAIDDNPSVKADPTKSTNYVQSALDEILAGKPVSKSKTKQYGCGIKYGK